ncbi:MAG: hypothetical protein JW741_05865 [Sedimentisphaerales bacterium]|nr:hypothetical protein [Sedimentisphaerales bacterium]
MSQEAQISSIATLKHLRACLTRFSETAAGALEETSSDIQRTVHWLRESQYGYWKNQTQKRQEQFAQAKLALTRKEIFDRQIAGNPASCVDERKALKRAERRLQEAQQKWRQVKIWVRQIEREMSDYKGAVQGLVSDVEVRIPNARARLDRMIDSLEAYVALAPPEAPITAEEAAAEDVEAVQREPVAGEPAPSLLERIDAWRKTAPPAEVRQDTPADSEPPEWLTDLACSESLRDAVHESAAETSAPEPTDKLVLARVKNNPDVVYLERTAAADGDSGWTIGAGADAEADGYVAIRIEDFLRVCPSAADVLGLPEGYAVLIRGREGREVLLGPDNQVLWDSLKSGPTTADEEVRRS